MLGRSTSWSRARPTSCDAAMHESAARHARPRRRRRRRARRAAAGAAADRVRRPACSRPDVADGVPVAQREHRGHARGGAGDREHAVAARARPRRSCRCASRSSRWVASGGAELSYGSDADVMFVYEPLERGGRRTRASSRTRSPHDCGRCCPRRPRPTRRWSSTPTCAPRAATARWCDRSPPTSSYYARWSSRVGGAGAAARPPDRRRRRARRPVHHDDRPGALPGGRRRAGRPDRDPPAQGPGRQRAAAARRRSRRRTPSSAAAAWPTSSGPSSCCSSITGTTCPGCGPPARSTRCAAAAEVGLLEPGQAETLAGAWRLATRVRNAIVLVRTRPTTNFPRSGTELIAVGRVLGYPAGFDPGQLDRRLPARGAACAQGRRTGLLRLVDGRSGTPGRGRIGQAEVRARRSAATNAPWPDSRYWTQEAEADSRGTGRPRRG